jgi:hypothetical protein
MIPLCAQVCEPVGESSSPVDIAQDLGDPRPKQHSFNRRTRSRKASETEDGVPGAQRSSRVFANAYVDLSRAGLWYSLALAPGSLFGSAANGPQGRCAPWIRWVCYRRWRGAEATFATAPVPAHSYPERKLRVLLFS